MDVYSDHIRSGLLPLNSGSMPQCFLLLAYISNRKITEFVMIIVGLCKWVYFTVKIKYNESVQRMWQQGTNVVFTGVYRYQSVYYYRYNACLFHSCMRKKTGSSTLMKNRIRVPSLRANALRKHRDMFVYIIYIYIYIYIVPGSPDR